MPKYSINLKPEFEERMRKLLGDDFGKFLRSLEDEPLRSIRVNGLKISVNELKKKLEAKGWKIRQPVKNHPEVIVVDSELEPGELGRSLEHLLGYYYIQEISSMLPVMMLSPKPGEKVLDLCASPGSKTTQIASYMKNTGLLIANEVDFNRMKILSSNLERCGVMNNIVTRKDGVVLCDRFAKQGFEFDRILVDAPCSGEGTLRINPKTAKMWNPKGFKKMPAIQKRLFSSAFKVLKKGGEIVYSTCTFAPEEDEEVVDYILREFKGRLEIEKISLPVKSRHGMEKWKDKEYLEEVRNSCRIFPFESNTEGFFIAKFKKIK